MFLTDFQNNFLIVFVFMLLKIDLVYNFTVPLSVSCFFFKCINLVLVFVKGLQDAKAVVEIALSVKATTCASIFNPNLLQPIV